MRKSVQQTHETLELAHFTVQEYLEALLEKDSYLTKFRLDPLNPESPRASLGYLCSKIFERPLPPTEKMFDEWLLDHPLYAFAAQATCCLWENLPSPLMSLHPYCRLLFAPQKTFNLMIYALFYLRELHQTKDTYTFHYELVCARNFQSLHIASLVQASDLCRMLLEQSCYIKLESPLGSALFIFLGDYWGDTGSEWRERIGISVI